MRQGFGNLYRQGNQAQSILVAMGLGVMFTLSVYLIQNSLVDEIIQTAPPGVPNVYLVGVTLEQSAPLKQLISSQDGILTAPQLFPVGFRAAGSDRRAGYRQPARARLRPALFCNTVRSLGKTSCLTI